MDKFDKIEKLKRKYLFTPNGHIRKEKIGEYNYMLSELIEPELYIQYLISMFETYVDVDSIITCTQHVYRALNANWIYKKIKDNVTQNQILTGWYELI